MNDDAREIIKLRFAGPALDPDMAETLESEVRLEEPGRLLLRRCM